MQHSDAPTKELERAKAQIEAMTAATQLQDFEAHWVEFLHRIERVWNKTVAHFGKSPKWHSWCGRITSIRRKDPLLSYLTNARGADEHGVAPITATEPSTITVNPLDREKPLYVRSMHVDSKYGPMHIDADNAEITFAPARTRLIAVTNRGRDYPPPMEHLGKSVDPLDVVAIARLAIQFYESVLNDAEQYFVN